MKGFGILVLQKKRKEFDKPDLYVVIDTFGETGYEFGKLIKPDEFEELQENKNISLTVRF